jgi:arsenate reductase
MFKVLFLCTHNSARSQMAEGLLRHFGGNKYEVFSAGTEATLVRPLAIQVMAELEIDISEHESKTIERFLEQDFDLVITVCDDAHETCPNFPGAKEQMHWSIPDPSKAKGDPEDQLKRYREIRDQLLEKIEALILAQSSPADLVVL